MGVVARKAYADVVAAQMLERVRERRYPVGGRLPSERELSEELGVSRPTVREALAALELMGAVSTHVGAGTYVVGAANGEPVVRTADASPFEILQFRLLLEPQIARVAARRWDRRTLAAITRPLRALEREAEVGSAEHPTLQDRQFHAAIAGATVNTVLIELSASLWELMSQTLWRRLKEREWTAAHTARVAEEHRKIFEAIRAPIRIHFAGRSIVQPERTINDPGRV